MKNKVDKYEVVFGPDVAEFIKINNGIETDVKVVAASEIGTEIRSLKIKNNTTSKVSLEVTSNFKPVLSKMEDDISHPAFNNLFLRYSMSSNGDLLVRRNKRGESFGVVLGANLNLENAEKEKAEYEIDSTKASELINKGEAFSSTLGLVTEPCIALRRKITIKPEEEIVLNFVICISENENDVTQRLEYYRIAENVKKEFSIARAKAEEEARYLNLGSNDLQTFYKILPYIVYQNPLKSVYMEELKGREYKQSDFWKYGISGDIPIILVTVKSANDIYIVKELLKVHENLRVKGIKTDLCILDYEKNIYEQFVKEQIIQEILNGQIGYLQNISGGIFLLNSNEIEDEDLFKFRANIWINASNSSTIYAIHDMEEEYKNKKQNIGYESLLMPNKNIEFEKQKPNIDIQNLKFYNGFGGFTDDGREYIIKTNKTENLPVTWSNVLANDKFGTIVTNNMGGFTYSKNSRLNRITSWANTPSNDVPSEIIYVRELNTGNTWTLNSNVMPDEEDYYMTFGFGYAKGYHANLGLIQETEIFVPKDKSAKVNIIRLKNTLSEKRKLKFVYYIKPTLGEDEIKTNGYIDLEFDKDKNILFAKNIYGDGLSKTVYVSSNEKIKSYTGNALSFIRKWRFKFSRRNI